ncbi:LytR C-terminal domain-containing protein [Streptomyces sp. MUM 203J]|uniref:LCP family protein n=1 Tax=Streptomyces sp. MUM 203J TaxID=2791990 RepID=UPI001F04287A|nr:LCP family protein [Streptomyces sp. MUM 203J]MCH0541961.1 LytR C-terminal domain-containing protein [Streptomyces sp. MUM 203J]
MNDQNNPYDPYHPSQPQLIGYDEYGQPVYQQAEGSQQPPQQSAHYDPYAAQQPPPQQPYGQGYDPYGQGQAYPQPQPHAYDYGQTPGYGQDGYADGYGARPWQEPAPHQPQASEPPGHQPGGPQQTTVTPAAAPPAPGSVPGAVPEQRRPAPGADIPRQTSPAPGPGGPDGTDDYRTEQFSFVEEPDEDSEDVIDWLKFTESRSERREEAKRRGRNRVIALVVVLAVALIGGTGYLWTAGLLPGFSEEDSRTGGTAATGPQKRAVIVLHLHNTKDEATSTALLVSNETTKQGTTVLLPNALAVANDDGTTTTLAKSVEDDGSSGTREAIGTLLGTEITGTWRLDTPYLENLVELVGGIEVDTDTAVPGAKKDEDPLVEKGENTTLDGRGAVAYATYRGPDESENRQLQRFGQVVHGVLRKLSDDPRNATMTVESLAQILDPSLPEKDLGASLAKLAEYAKAGDHKTALLPVQGDGRLSGDDSRSVVKDILGGSVTAPEQGSVVRVAVRDATGDEATESARIVLVNGGYAVIDSGKGGSAPASEVLYGDDARKPMAQEVAKTLGLPAGAVKKGEGAANADVTVVLGDDYKAR